MKYSYIVILFVAMALLLTACSQSNSPATPAVTTGDNANAQVQNTATENTPAAAAKTLKEVFAGRTLKYTGEYTVTVNGTSSDLTQAFDVPKYVMLMNTSSGESRTIFDGTSMVTCSNTGGSWQCLKITASQPESARVEDSVNQDTTKTVVIGTCKDAGETGTKYEVTPADGKKSTVCYTNDGILLEVTAEDSSYSMVATKISRSVDSTLFVPPAEPQDLSALMANIPTQ